MCAWVLRAGERVVSADAGVLADAGVHAETGVHADAGVHDAAGVHADAETRSERRAASTAPAFFPGRTRSGAVPAVANASWSSTPGDCTHTSISCTAVTAIPTLSPALNTHQHPSIHTAKRVRAIVFLAQGEQRTDVIAAPSAPLARSLPLP